MNALQILENIKSQMYNETEENLEIAETQKEIELSLQEKLMLAQHPAVKEALAVQVEEEVEKAKAFAATLLEIQKVVNEEAFKAAAEMGYKHLRFRIFINPEADEVPGFKLMAGEIVHVHYTGTFNYIVSPKFWKTHFPRMLPQISKLQRTTALVMRSTYREMKLDMIPKWKIVRFDDENFEFDLPKHDEHSTETEVRIKKWCKVPGRDKPLIVSVAGPMSKWASLEREALVLLGQKRRLWYLSQQANDEMEVLDRIEEIG